VFFFSFLKTQQLMLRRRIFVHSPRSEWWRKGQMVQGIGEHLPSRQLQLTGNFLMKTCASRLTSLCPDTCMTGTRTPPQALYLFVCGYWVRHVSLFSTFRGQDQTIEKKIDLPISSLNATAFMNDDTRGISR